MIIGILVSIIFMISIFFLGWFIYLSYQYYKITIIKSKINEIDKSLINYHRQLTLMIDRIKKIK